MKADADFSAVGFAYADRPRSRRTVCKACFNAGRRGKVCPCCGVKKQRGGFWMHKGKIDGLRTYCKKCMVDQRRGANGWRGDEMAAYYRQVRVMRKIRYIEMVRQQSGIAIRIGA